MCSSVAQAQDAAVMAIRALSDPAKIATQKAIGRFLGGVADFSNRMPLLPIHFELQKAIWRGTRARQLDSLWSLAGVSEDSAVALSTN
jgi:hypothetical protein